MAVGATTLGLGVTGAVAQPYTEIAAPTIITEPGEYVITQDFAVTRPNAAELGYSAAWGEAVAIGIDTAGVSIVGNGHTITGPDQCLTSEGIVSRRPSVNVGGNITVDDVTVQGFSRGISTESSTEWELTGVRANGNHGPGFSVIDDQATLTDCTALENQHAGVITRLFNPDDHATPSGGLVCENTVVADNLNSGFAVGYGEFEFTNCESTGNFGAGLAVHTDGRVTATQSSFCANENQSGVYVGPEAQGEFRENVVNNNEEYGFYINYDSLETVVRNNTVLNNGLGPFFVHDEADNVTIEGNDTAV